MEKEELAIGIDLGTTYSCVGCFLNGQVKIFENDQGNKTTPSYVAFTEDSEILVGEAAKNYASLEPARTIFDVKRLIGRKFKDPTVQEDLKFYPYVIQESKTGGIVISVPVTKDGKSEVKEFVPEQLSAQILIKMKEIAERSTGQKIQNAVVTVPAYFNDAQRQATKDACEIAGMKPLRIINEPTAASIAYGLDKQKTEKEQYFMVFDYGGGTLDVTLLSLLDGTIQVKATSGDCHLGGEDLDNKLVMHCLSEIKTKYQTDLSEKKYAKSVRRLKTECEKAKRQLSNSPYANLGIECLFIDSKSNPVNYETRITRTKFESLAEKDFKRCLEPVEQVLKDANLPKSEIKYVVMVGGSSRIPKIRELLIKFFEKSKEEEILCNSVNPDECVAFGASFQASVLMGNTIAMSKEIVLADVLPLSLGVETAGGGTSHVLKRNTRIPAKATMAFSTATDNQPSVTVKIYEGERSMTKDNSLLGEFELYGIPPLPRGRPKIDVTIEVDANGIVCVTAEEKSTGNTKKITIKNQSGRLNKTDIEKMVNEAEKFKQEDEESRERILAKNTFESYVFDLKNRLVDLEAKLSPDDVKIMTAAAGNSINWINENRYAPAKEIQKKQREIEKICIPIIEKLYDLKKPIIKIDKKIKDEEVIEL